MKDVINKFNLSPKTTWEYNKVLEIKEFREENLVRYDYRPFDTRFIYYNKNFLSRSRSEVMDNFFKQENIGLENSRNGDYTFISGNISDEHFVSDNSFKFPLYLYTEDGSKISNLKKEIVKDIEKIVNKVKPENILDYIYAILYSPSYRGKYKEFLKIDFPRVPYPKDNITFIKLAELGRELRALHLLESSKLIPPYFTEFSESGNDTVEKAYPKYKNDRVYINENQYFGNVPPIAWNFFIGGYQPAQKWLKDRQGRKLSNEEIEHYQKIIVAFSETDRIMEEIDKIIIG